MVSQKYIKWYLKNNLYKINWNNIFNSKKMQNNNEYIRKIFESSIIKGRNKKRKYNWWFIIYRIKVLYYLQYRCKN